MLISIVFLIVALLSYSKKDNDVGVRLFVLLFSVFAVFFALTTSDFPIYKTFYKNVEPLSQVLQGNKKVFLYDYNDFEMGYKIVNSFFRMFTPYVETLYIFCNVLIVILAYYFFRDKADNFYKLFLPYYAFFFIPVQAGIIRQALAIIIFYVSIEWIIQRKFFSYMLASLIGFLFHVSAIILPLLYFVANRVYSKTSIVVVFSVGVLFYLQIIPFSPIEIIGTLSDLLLSSVGSKLSFYLSQAKELGAPNRLNLGIIENATVLVVILHIRRKMEDRGQWDDFLNISFNLSLIYIFLYLYLFDIYTFLYRLNYYFVFFKFFIIVRYIETQYRWKKFCLHSILVIYCAVMLVSKILQGH